MPAQIEALADSIKVLNSSYLLLAGEITSLKDELTTIRHAQEYEVEAWRDTARRNGPARPDGEHPPQEPPRPSLEELDNAPNQSD
jgi:hypothetical protein